MNYFKKNILIGENNKIETYGNTGILIFLDNQSIINLALTNKAIFSTCYEYLITTEINKNKITKKNFVSSKKIRLIEREIFLNKRSLLSEEKQTKLDQEFFDTFKNKDNLKECQDLYNLGASLSFLNQEGHTFDNFSCFLRRVHDYDQITLQKFKIYINSIINIQDLNDQKADYTEQENFFQILFLQEFQHFPNSQNLFCGALQLLHQIALNFDICLGVRDIISNQYYGIFNHFNYYEETEYEYYSSLEPKDEFFYLLNPTENKINFGYQLDFLKIIADNLDLIEHHPNKDLNVKISEHYNILIEGTEELIGFYKEKLVNEEGENCYVPDYEVVQYEKSVKILVGLIPVYYKYSYVMWRGLLDVLFLKFKGLVFKHVEKNNKISEDLKGKVFCYLLEKYFGKKFSRIENFFFNFYEFHENNKFEKSEYFEKLEEEFYEDKEDSEFLYRCIISFLAKKNKYSGLISKIIKFEEENKVIGFSTKNIKNPITEQECIVNLDK